MRSRHVLAVVALMGVITAIVFGLERMAPSPEPTAGPVESSVEDPVSGTWVCGFGDARQDASATVVAVRPGAAGDLPGQYDLEALHEGGLERIAESRLFPGSAVGTPLTDDTELTASVLRWRGAPVATWREWSLQATEDVPAATVSGPCAAPWAPRWYIPGLSTEGGDEARIRLTNPYAGAATVAVGFRTPTGVEEPLILRNVTVPGRSTREIVVNETLPERADLGAVIDVISGRVSVEGVQLARAAIGDVDGASLLAAAPEALEEWTIPWLVDDDARSSWLWVMNPGERTATVELTMHTESGGVVPDGLAELTVPAGEQRRVDLSGTLPDDVVVAALTARSNGAPVVISGATVWQARSPELTGLSVQLGVAPDPAWIVVGSSAGGRTETLRLVNPTSEPALVDVRLFDGLRVLEPTSLQGLELPPGVAITVPLDEQLGDVDTWTALVDAREGAIVAGRVGSVAQPAPPAEVDDTADTDAEVDDADDAEDADDDAETEDAVDADAPQDPDGDGDDARRLVAVPGVPSASWSPRPIGLRARASDRLVLDLRTADGVDPATDGVPAPSDPDGDGGDQAPSGRLEDDDPDDDPTGDLDDDPTGDPDGDGED
jgi:hypothetical protein